MTTQTQLRRLEQDVGELLERHERGQDVRSFRRYRDRPVAFIREVLRGEPWSRQEEIAEAVLKDPLVAVRSCNAAGKDWIAAQLALWWVYARQGKVLLTGPTERQVVEVCMSEVARAFRRAEELPGDLYRTALRLPGSTQAGLLAFTSTEASRLTGFHAPRVLAVLTEAQGVEDFAWEGVLACATGDEDRVLAVGNPLAPSGRFFVSSRSRGWRSLRISAEEHPNLVEGRAVIPGGPSRAFVDRIRSEYGEGSPIYTARVLGEFPDQAEDSLLRRSWLDAAAERWRLADREAEGESSLVAVDPARFGPDETVCAVRRGSVITELAAWRGVDLMDTVDRVREVAEAAGVTNGEGIPTRPPGGKRAGTMHRHDKGNAHRPRGRLVVDEVGLGGGVADRLRQLGYVVYGHNGGKQAGEASRFMNVRAEAYWRLREMLEAGRVALPPDEGLFDELLALRWRPTMDGKVRLEAKEELKARIGRSPDRADAVTMALATRLPRRSPRRSEDARIRQERLAFKYARATRWTARRP